MVCGYLLDPRRRGYPLEELCEEAGLAVTGVDEDPAARDAALVWMLAADQERRMAAEGVDRLAHDVELPLIPVLAAMERTGVRLDVHVLAEIAGRVRDQVEELRDRIWEHAGGEFVIDSPKQLGEVLFERLGPAHVPQGQDRLVDRPAGAQAPRVQAPDRRRSSASTAS